MSVKLRANLEHPAMARAIGTEIMNSCTQVDAAGGVSRDWILRAARLPGKSLHLATALQFAIFDQGRRDVMLGNVAWQAFGVDRNAKYRSLTWMENEGLINVERRMGRAPVVIILEIRPLS